MDGKLLRMSALWSARSASTQHLLSLYNHRLGLGLAQVAVADKSNESGASDDLPGHLLRMGVVLTGDGIFTQTAIAQRLLAQGNDDLVIVKENQPTLHDDLQSAHRPPPDGRCILAR